MTCEPPNHIVVDEEDDFYMCDNGAVFTEPIKEDDGFHGEDEEMLTEDCPRRVGFSSVVSVLPIPSRKDYPSHVRTSVWSSRKEISEMTARNMAEFAAEGWDWRKATEDEDMLLRDGEIVHPVHGNFFLREALERQIPYPRAVTPPEDDRSLNEHHPMHCENLDRGAVIDDAEEMERPASPFVESMVFEDSRYNYDEILLVSDPDQFLRQRFGHRHRQDVPFGDSEDAFYNQVMYTNNR